MKVSYFISSLIVFSLFVSTMVYSQSERARINLCGNTNSDLYVLLRKNDIGVNLYRNPQEAITHAKKGTGVLILADSYPKQKTSISNRLLEIAKEKELRLYIEYPASLPGLSIQDTVVAPMLDRGVVVSDVFGDKLGPMSILGINGCHVIPVNVKDPLIVLGKVAGLDKAAYGLKGVKTYPLLFRKGNMLVAMTRLSSFATGRYQPEPYWKIVWQYIMSWVSGDKNIELHHWLSYVSPMYARNEPLAPNAMRTSIRKGVQWLFNGHFFVDSTWEKLYVKDHGNVPSPVGKYWPNGNGSLGIFEGQTSQIYYNGSQPVHYWVRADNEGQVAYALAAAGHFLNKKNYYKYASNLTNYVFYHSNLRSGLKNDRRSPAFGLIGWATTAPGAFYGDDNAHLLLGLIGAEAYMKTHRWDKEIAEGIVANFRTTGREGFRGDRIDQNKLLKHGWKYYWNRNIINPHPHFEAWMWACYLWLYSRTGYKPLLTRTERAIRTTMQDYPKNWIWTNGLQQERARMILPLAWLVRIQNTPEHRKWLNEVVSGMLKYQAPRGAIREELGTPGKGFCPPPKSNQAYGTAEEPLIFRNGEPVSDMLYTCNFALFALNEAAHATKNKKYMAAEKKLADFLIRIQVKSAKHRALDGAWFRTFDYGQWDYWGANGDAGWGAWSTNTGWIQGWIVPAEVLLENNQSFWTLTKSSTINDVMPQTVRIMFGKETK
ncbi:MAG: hypothetical protein M1469_12745 [Bacteroidetes bacterium]|nr:hypothetical protein [Bacteroidota bacterium]